MTLKEIKILGVKVNPIVKEDFLEHISAIIDNFHESKKESRYVVTPYSEFFIISAKDEYFKKVLNESAISLPDGIFPVWAAYFMDKNARNKSRGLLKKLSVLGNFFVCGLEILIKPQNVTKIIPERVSGSVVVYDIARLAAEKGYKIAILGGFDFGSGNTGLLAADKLKQLYKNIKIVEVYPGNREKEEYGGVVVDTLAKSGADILFCCYGPVKQEKWMYENLSKTGIAVGIGLGGTLDYISGVKRTPPDAFRKLGLEWFFRPFYAEGFGNKRFFKRLFRAWPAMAKSSMMVLSAELKK